MAYVIRICVHTTLDLMIYKMVDGVRFTLSIVRQATLGIVVGCLEIGDVMTYTTDETVVIGYPAADLYSAGLHPVRVALAIPTAPVATSSVVGLI